MADGSSTAMFIADSPALDFLNTIYSPGDTAVETIDNGEAYLAWLLAAGLVPPEGRQSFAKDAGPGELDAVAAQARTLREWFRAFVLKYRGKP
uniref:ABATE domain-containing protein n=1 Tax=uncultured Caulobacter sp. TaxID=158749 RepID=UPI0025F8767F